VSAGILRHIRLPGQGGTGCGDAWVSQDGEQVGGPLQILQLPGPRKGARSKARANWERDNWRFVVLGTTHPPEIA
jgi:hypothetical protein